MIAHTDVAKINVHLLIRPAVDSSIDDLDPFAGAELFLQQMTKSRRIGFTFG